MPTYDITTHVGLSANAQALVSSNASLFAFHVRTAEHLLGIADVAGLGDAAKDALALQVNDLVDYLPTVEGGRLTEEKVGRLTFKRGHHTTEVAINPIAKRMIDDALARIPNRPAAKVKQVDRVQKSGSLTRILLENP